MTTRFQLVSKAVLVASLATGLSACASSDYGQKETIGTLVGAGLGAWAGSAVDHHGSGGVVAVAAGTVLGGLIGNQIGKTMDKVDRQQYAQTQYQTLEYTRSGESKGWYNPDSGNSGSFVAKPAYQNTDGRYCREFTQTVTISGKREEAYGTACRQADGTWKIIS